MFNLVPFPFTNEFYFFNFNACQSHEKYINKGGERIHKDSKNVHALQHFQSVPNITGVSNIDSVSAHNNFVI